MPAQKLYGDSGFMLDKGARISIFVDLPKSWPYRQMALRAPRSPSYPQSQHRASPAFTTACVQFRTCVLVVTLERPRNDQTALENKAEGNPLQTAGGPVTRTAPRLGFEGAAIRVATPAAPNGREGTGVVEGSKVGRLAKSVSNTPSERLGASKDTTRSV